MLKGHSIHIVILDENRKTILLIIGNYIMVALFDLNAFDGEHLNELVTFGNTNHWFDLATQL